MNPLNSNPEMALTLARHTVDDRLRDAEQRARALAVRDNQRAARRPSSAVPRGRFPLPLAAFRFFKLAVKAERRRPRTTS